MIKKIIFSILAFIHILKARIHDFQNRYYIKIVQFFSIRKAEKRAICNKYVLSSDEKKKIDAFYKLNYGRTIDHKWHRYFAGINNTFTKEYIPMSIHFSEIEYFLNPYKEYIKVFEDKSIISLIAKSIGIKCPRALFTFTNGTFTDEQFNYIGFSEVVKQLSNYGEIFIKPTVDSSGGKGCCICNIQNGIDTYSGESIESILKKSGKYFLIQNVIRNHKSISKIYDKSLNTFRIITYQWQESIYNAPVVMRMGRNGNRVDNACAGGIYIGVENDGTLLRNAYFDDGSVYQIHPDTKLVFGDYHIISIQGAIDAAKRMHKALSKLGIVNWDFSIDENGDPVLIEANIVGGGMDMIQVAHAKPLFEEHTPEILQWVRLMKSLPVHKREPYYFGKRIVK